MLLMDARSLPPYNTNHSSYSNEKSTSKEKDDSTSNKSKFSRVSSLTKTLRRKNEARGGDKEESATALSGGSDHHNEFYQPLPSVTGRVSGSAVPFKSTSPLMASRGSKVSADPSQFQERIDAMEAERRLMEQKIAELEERNRALANENTALIDASPTLSRRAAPATVAQRRTSLELRSAELQRERARIERSIDESMRRIDQTVRSSGSVTPMASPALSAHRRSRATSSARSSSSSTVSRVKKDSAQPQRKLSLTDPNGMTIDLRASVEGGAFGSGLKQSTSAPELSPRGLLKLSLSPRATARAAKAFGANMPLLGVSGGGGDSSPRMRRECTEQLDAKPWWMPNGTRQEAEERLRVQPVNAFVVRPSSSPGHLAFSQKLPGGDIRHVLLAEVRDGRGVLTGYCMKATDALMSDGETFPTLEALLRSVIAPVQVRIYTQLLCRNLGIDLGGHAGGAGGGGVSNNDVFWPYVVVETHPHVTVSDLQLDIWKRLVQSLPPGVLYERYRRFAALLLSDDGNYLTTIDKKPRDGSQRLMVIAAFCVGLAHADERSVGVRGGTVLMQVCDAFDLSSGVLFAEVVAPRLLRTLGVEAQPGAMESISLASPILATLGAHCIDWVSPLLRNVVEAFGLKHVSLLLETGASLRRESVAIAVESTTSRATQDHSRQMLLFFCIDLVDAIVNAVDTLPREVRQFGAALRACGVDIVQATVALCVILLDECACVWLRQLSSQQCTFLSDREDRARAAHAARLAADVLLDCRQHSRRVGQVRGSAGRRRWSSAPFIVQLGIHEHGAYEKLRASVDKLADRLKAWCMDGLRGCKGALLLQSTSHWSRAHFVTLRQLHRFVTEHRFVEETMVAALVHGHLDESGGVPLPDAGLDLDASTTTFTAPMRLNGTESAQTESDGGGNARSSSSRPYERVAELDTQSSSNVLAPRRIGERERTHRKHLSECLGALLSASLDTTKLFALHVLDTDFAVPAADMLASAKEHEPTLDEHIFGDLDEREISLTARASLPRGTMTTGLSDGDMAALERGGHKTASVGGGGGGNDDVLPSFVLVPLERSVSDVIGRLRLATFLEGDTDERILSWLEATREAAISARADLTPLDTVAKGDDGTALFDAGDGGADSNRSGAGGGADGAALGDADAADVVDIADSTSSLASSSSRRGGSDTEQWPSPNTLADMLQWRFDDKESCAFRTASYVQHLAAVRRGVYAESAPLCRAPPFFGMPLRFPVRVQVGALFAKTVMIGTEASAADLIALVRSKARNWRHPHMRSTNPIFDDKQEYILKCDGREQYVVSPSTVVSSLDFVRARLQRRARVAFAVMPRNTVRIEGIDAPDGGERWRSLQLHVPSPFVDVDTKADVARLGDELGDSALMYTELPLSASHRVRADPSACSVTAYEEDLRMEVDVRELVVAWPLRTRQQLSSSQQRKMEAAAADLQLELCLRHGPQQFGAMHRARTLSKEERRAVSLGVDALPTGTFVARTRIPCVASFNLGVLVRVLPRSTRLLVRVLNGKKELLAQGSVALYRFDESLEHGELLLSLDEPLPRECDAAFEAMLQRSDEADGGDRESNTAASKGTGTLRAKAARSHARDTSVRAGSNAKGAGMLRGARFRVRVVMLPAVARLKAPVLLHFPAPPSSEELSARLQALMTSEKVVPPNSDELARLDKLGDADDLYTMSGDDVSLINRFRALLNFRPRLIVRVIQSLDWQDPEQVSDLHALVDSWPSLLATDALYLLSRDFPDPMVRAFAVRCLHDCTDDELINYLPQLVQLLKCEPLLDSPLAAFLVQRGVARRNTIGQALAWQLRVEARLCHERQPTMARRFVYIMERYARLCGDHIKVLCAQARLVHRLDAIANEVKALPWGRERQERMSALCARYLSRMPPFMRAPHDASLRLGPLIVKQSRALDSHQAPLLLCFENAGAVLDPMSALDGADDGNGTLRRGTATLRRATLRSIPSESSLGGGGGVAGGGTGELSSAAVASILAAAQGGTMAGGTLGTTSSAPSAEPVRIIFKIGDDMRQDMLTLQTLATMERLWLNDGLDMRLTLYPLMVVDDEVGLLHCVPECETLAKIQVAHGGGVTGALKETPLKEWLQQFNRSEEEMSTCVETFVRSCAGYCVATYVLGIGDRHNDNIMLTRYGHLFHIDFGHFLGNFMKWHGLKRERAAFTLTPEMVYVMGGKQSGNFERFVDLAQQAFLSVRRHANAFITLLALMLPTGIRELRHEQDIEPMRRAFLLDRTDEEAAAAFAKLINESLATLTTRLNFAIHIFAHKKALK